MRFRLTTKPPLPLIKAWYALSPTPGLDVAALKAELCSRLPALHQHGVSPNQILLSIDEFELLDESELDVLKENDLVCISLAPSSVPVSRKRRASSPNPAPRKRWKSSAQNVQYRPSETSSASSSSESSSASDSTSSSSESPSSDTTSDSDSDSESESESESDSDSAVETQPSKRPVNGSLSGAQLKNIFAKPAAATVPPGKGRQSTHNRNARRRLKRLHEKERAEGAYLASRSIAGDSANAIPLGAQRSSAAASQPPEGSTVADSELHPKPTGSNPVPGLATVEAEQIASTLKNKNKKKGFRRDMSGITPQRIVFSTGAERTSASDAHGASQAVDGVQRPSQMLTPSEKQARGLLPPNVFVTSVEVEGDRWDRKKKKKQRDVYGYEADAAWPDTSYGEVANGDASLDYGEPEEIPGKSKSTDSTKEVDWDSIDASWDRFKAVGDIASLSPGSLVGWKELAINPVTFTPEMLARVARVKQLDQACSIIALVPVRRPGEDEIAFGRAGASADDDADDADHENGDPKDGEEIQEEIQEVTFEDAVASQWKLVEL